MPSVQLEQKKMHLDDARERDEIAQKEAGNRKEVREMNKIWQHPKRKCKKKIVEETEKRGIY